MSKTINPIEEIKKRLDIVEEISKHIKLEKTGDRYVGFCPFHTNTNTPALTVYPHQQTWWCYGCNKGGDVLVFLQEIGDVELSDLIRKYAEKFGLTLRKLSWKERRRFAYHKTLYSVIDTAANFFHLHLLWSPEAEGARKYLAHRGINTDTIIDFKIGYAPDSWDWLYKQLVEREFDDKDIITAGMGRKRRDGKGCYDFFRNRIVFPIQTNGNIMGFGGRLMGGSPNGAKYINTPNTPVFSKRRAIYGLTQARTPIKEQGEVIIVEGYMDVLALHQAGFRNTISIMGISLTKEQADLLSHHTKKITLALDPDEAAEIAVERLKLERQVNLDIYVAQLPDKRDPDEIVIESPDMWPQILKESKPLPMYMTDYLIKKHQPNDPKERRDIANMITPMIDIVDDPHEQAGYQEYLATALGYQKYIPNVRCPHCGKKYHGDEE